MNETLNTPTNRDEKDQVDYGDLVVSQLLGATICAFGATHAGEIFLVARKGDERHEFIIGKDPETGEIAIFEVEEGAAEVPA